MDARVALLRRDGLALLLADAPPQREHLVALAALRHALLLGVRLRLRLGLGLGVGVGVRVGVGLRVGLRVGVGVRVNALSSLRLASAILTMAILTMAALPTAPAACAWPLLTRAPR
jgi:hypothetical protein